MAITANAANAKTAALRVELTDRLVGAATVFEAT
jgi:hypothetical protein